MGGYIYRLKCRVCGMHNSLPVDLVLSEQETEQHLTMQFCGECGDVWDTCGSCGYGKGV